jgi:hypothetical protein
MYSPGHVAEETDREPSDPIGKLLPQPLACPEFLGKSFVPWFASVEITRHPTYLYDARAGKTLRVGQDISEDTAYVAISHSWGQTRIHQSYVEVEGTPWRVPRNARFSMEELKSDLSELSRFSALSTYRYVWIDLFCIPQDWEDPAWVLIMARETQNQVAIFRRAEKAIVWISQVGDWKPVQCALSVIALRVSDHLVREPPEASSHLSQNAEISSELRSLCKHEKLTISGVQDTRLVDLFAASAWFTSLWTLSEYWARPDMAFVDKSWTVLTASEWLGAPYVTAGSLGRLAALLSNMEMETWSTSAPAAHSLACTLIRSHMGHIEHVSRASIILAASRRVCNSPRRSRRAQAIMHVLGATKWYGTGDPASTEQNMVLGQYPASFLREVASLEGAAFFTVIDVEETGFWSIFGPRESSPLSPGATTERASVNMLRIAGTLLPFYSGDAALAVGTPRKILAQRLPGIKERDHPWTQSWLIGNDGRILIDQVGILACVEPESDNHDNGTKMHVNTQVTLHFLQRDDLRMFEKRCQKTGVRDYMSKLSWWPYAKYAIMLREGDIMSALPSFGIIVLELLNEQSGRRHFGKLQHFWCHAELTTGVAMQNVNWDVF